jgi:alkylated DNA repair dioxygenase AlkB
MKRTAERNNASPLCDDLERRILEEGAIIDSFKLPLDVRPSAEDMRALWALRPATRSQIKIMGKTIEVPRFDQAYGSKGYRFSGVDHPPRPMPEILARYLAYANKVMRDVLDADYGGRDFNMCFTNWYSDGTQYIGFHSDDESQLYKNHKSETLVFSISFGQKRVFVVKPKNKESREGAMRFELDDGDVLVMGGLCQKNYKHGLPAVTSKKQVIAGRINLTFRIFK